MISKEEQIEEMGMTIALLESDLLDYKTQVEQLQKEVERLNRIDNINQSEIRRLRGELFEALGESYDHL